MFLVHIIKLYPNFFYLHLASFLHFYLPFSLLWFVCIQSMILFFVITALHRFSSGQNSSCVGFPGHCNWGDHMIFWFYKFIRFSFYSTPMMELSSHCQFHDSIWGFYTFTCWSRYPVEFSPIIILFHSIFFHLGPH